MLWYVFTEYWYKYAPGVVQTVLSEGDYNRSKKGMIILEEVLQQLQLEVFAFGSINFQHAGNECLSSFQEIFQTKQVPKDWKYSQKKLNRFDKSLDNFIRENSTKNVQFKFWNTFLEDIVTTLIYFNRSYREGKRKLHISAVRRAIHLFFSFNRTNYRRLAPLYLEDCLLLETKFQKVMNAS